MKIAVLSSYRATIELKTFWDILINGNFDIDAIPENFKYWLSCYESEMKHLKQKTESDIKVFEKSNKDSIFMISVGPLLENIKWGQNDPYNMFCPIYPYNIERKTVTGCVATAMAQIMRYYKYPAQGTGEYSYKTKTHGFELSANFGETIYDWENIMVNKKYQSIFLRAPWFVNILLKYFL